MTALRLGRRATLALLVGTALAAPALAQTKTVIRFSSAAPPPDFLAKSMIMFKDAVDKAAPGQFDIQLYPGGKLVRQGAEVPAIQRGNLEMSTMQAFEVAQQVPEYGFFARAYLFRDYAHMHKVFSGPIGAEYAKRVADKMGIVILATTYLGTRQLNLRTVREVKSPADLAGVKMRMPAGGPDWLLVGQTLGVNSTVLGMPEVYLALQTGSIDGQENPLTIMNAAKFYEVTKQVVLTAHMVQPVFHSIAKPVWDKMTPAQQKAFRDAALAAAKWNDEQRLADEKKVVDRIKGLGLRVDAIDLKPFRDNADKVYAASAHTKAWDKAMMKRVLDTK
ncbi:MAG: TRAP transporter substrate-binding protein DctP [Rhodospirillaceae bacterium]|nr:TRAP transporter substrate-binding protein DctP [Rhodospirillaceae bacterium]